MPKSILTRPGVRWAVPGGVAAAIVGAAVLVPVFADTEADLPELTPMELMAEIAEAEPRPVAGTLVHTTDAGLPEIPGLTDQSSGIGSKSGLISSVLSGSTTARVWYSDPEHVRVALQDDLVENDLIRNGDDVWVWSSSDNTAMHLDLGEADAADIGDMAGPGTQTPGSVPTPDAVADEMLESVKHTDITVDGTATVAGRDAYEIVLNPSTEGTLIESVRIAIDGEYFQPLRVQVFSTSDTDEPSVEFGYTSVTFSEPDASVYEFSPPEGAEVEEFDPMAWAPGDHSAGPNWDASNKPEITGEGWATVVVIPDVSLDDLTSLSMGDDSSMDGLSDLLMTQLDRVEGPYGSGLAYQTDLFSVLLLDDGRLLAGPVTVDTLEQAAGAE